MPTGPTGSDWCLLVPLVLLVLTGSAGSDGVTGPTGPTGADGSDGTSVGFTSGNTAPSGSNTGDFWYENDTGLYYANVYDGSTLAWLQVSGRPGPTGEQGPAGAGSGGSTLSAGDGLTLSQNVAGVGYTLGIDPTAVVHVAGVSADEGITANRLNSGEYGHYIEMNRASDKIAIRPQGALQYTFGVSTFVSGVGSNTFAGTLSVDGLANLKAGISSDAGIVIPTGLSYGWSDGAFINNSSGTLQLASSSGYYSMQVASGSVSFYRDVFCEDELHVAGAAGISADYGMSIGTGITFPDGTFQSSAASGSGVTAGAGMVLTGSTLGIDPTAVVHVAGVTMPDNGQLGNESGTFVELQPTQVRLKPSGVLSFASLSSKNVSHKDLQVVGETIAQDLIHAERRYLTGCPWHYLP